MSAFPDRPVGRVVLIALGPLLLTLACARSPDKDTSDEQDQVLDDDIGDCMVDDSRMRPAAQPDWQLEPGQEGLTGYICPRGDIDHYWFETQAPGTIVQVSLSNNVQMTAVDLCYTIFPEEGNQTLGSNCDHDGMDGYTAIEGNHYLEQAGRYFLEVRDESNDEKDDRGVYLIRISEQLDPDPYEPNNNAESARSIGPDKAFIGYQGDEDWYKIDVSSTGQLLRLQLTTDNPSPVDLEYSLLRSDGQTPVNTGRDDNGNDRPTSLKDVLPVHEPGTYYLVVRDLAGDDNEIEVGYHLSIELVPDPDPRDRDQPNNNHQLATPLNSGSEIIDGYIASRADEDWYKIEGTRASVDQPSLLEVEVELPQGSTVEPAIDLLVRDRGTPCADGDACTHLTATCGGDCDVCRDAMCPSHECDFRVGHCRAAGFCLEGGCAIRHLFIQGSDWSPTGNVRHLRTVAPLSEDTIYVLVRDFQSDSADTDHPYRLKVTVKPEKDVHESPPNGLYLPYATNELEKDTRPDNQKLAKEIPCNDSGGVITCGPITGYLSYRGDQDWFKLTGFPREEEPEPEAQSLMQDYDIQYEFRFAGNPKMELNYLLYKGSIGNNPHSAVCATPGPNAIGKCWENTTSGVFGQDECVYLCGEYQKQRPFYLGIMHHDRKQYDYDEPYQITIKGYRDCPMSCSKYCGAGVDAHACPNPRNPDPANE